MHLQTGLSQRESAKALHLPSALSFPMASTKPGLFAATDEAVIEDDNQREVRSR
jgi:hypothetical protein